MEAYKSIESIYLLNNIDQMAMALKQAICKQAGVTIQREWGWVIKDGKAYCGQSAVSRVIIYLINLKFYLLNDIDQMVMTLNQAFCKPTGWQFKGNEGGWLRMVRPIVGKVLSQG